MRSGSFHDLETTRATSGNYLQNSLPTALAEPTNQHTPEDSSVTYGEQSPLDRWISSSGWSRQDVQLALSAVSIVLSIATVAIMMANGGYL